jgi:hypothetical protein
VARLRRAAPARQVLAGGSRRAAATSSGRVGQVSGIRENRVDRVVVREAAHAQVARGYRNLLLDEGFEDVSCEARTGVLTDPTLALPALTSMADGAISTGAVSAAQADAWLDDQRRLPDRDRLLVAFPLFLAAGRQP